MAQGKWNIMYIYQTTYFRLFPRPLWGLLQVYFLFNALMRLKTPR